jgi:hypothetical protein
MGRRTLMASVAIVTLFVSACGSESVSGQATAPEAAENSATMMPVTPVVPTAASDTPVAENPFAWVSDQPYDGTLEVEGITSLKLMNPIERVRDRVDAVGYLGEGEQCAVAVTGLYGSAPATYGVFVYDDPSDLDSFDQEYNLDAVGTEKYMQSVLSTSRC